MAERRVLQPSAFRPFILYKHLTSYLVSIASVRKIRVLPSLLSFGGLDSEIIILHLTANYFKPKQRTRGVPNDRNLSVCFVRLSVATFPCC